MTSASLQRVLVRTFCFGQIQSKISQPVIEDGGSIPNACIEFNMPKSREIFERKYSIHEASRKEIDTSDFIEINQAMLVIRALLGHTATLQRE